MKLFWIFLLVLPFLPLTAPDEDPRLKNVLMVRTMENIPTDLINKQLAHIKKSYPEFSMDFPLPTFKLATNAYMVDLYKRLSGGEANVSALYVHQFQNPITMEIVQGRTIYLHIQWDLGNVENRGSLYHELLHYIQFMNGLDNFVECSKVLEFQAYDSSANYLIEVEKLPKTHKLVREAIQMSFMEGACPQTR